MAKCAVCGKGAHFGNNVLFDFPAPRSEKQQKLDAALDNIRAKYGKDAIKRGRFL